MARIHHNTVKKAAKFGLEMVVVENVVKVMKGGEVLAEGADAKEVLEAAIAKLGGGAKPAKVWNGAGTKKVKAKAKKKVRAEFGDEDEEGFGEEEEGDDEEGKSVVKKKYKTKYRPFKMTCGDDLANLVAKHLKEKGEDGKDRINEAKLKNFAVANACWISSYKDLNVGMRRMNVVNRLRARIRKDNVKVVWAS